MTSRKNLALKPTLSSFFFIGRCLFGRCELKLRPFLLTIIERGFPIIGQSSMGILWQQLSLAAKLCTPHNPRPCLASTEKWLRGVVTKMQFPNKMNQTALLNADSSTYVFFKEIIYVCRIANTNGLLAENSQKLKI